MVDSICLAKQADLEAVAFSGTGRRLGRFNSDGYSHCGASTYGLSSRSRAPPFPPPPPLGEAEFPEPVQVRQKMGRLAAFWGSKEVIWGSYILSLHTQKPTSIFAPRSFWPSACLLSTTLLANNFRRPKQIHGLHNENEGSGTGFRAPSPEWLLRSGRGLCELALCCFPSLGTASPVNLCNCRQVTDAGLLQLLACPTVTALNLSCMPAITADGVEKLCNALPIQSLELSGCSRIREVDLVKRFGRFIEFDDDEDGLNKVQG
ncbi:hypothetical protein AK812_SmicGene13680 [Symbiodinium microadriaticum]|uniref:Uncharacterized protein n=1 Tax=Symbiodinium microadriaticum TaxID=2951 RepID=A0A1Q9E7F0_SYMMI|nr:hypothetical protein AK812_SmicGene13680 [Symbiodinium microadriaticum]